ncbi:hypothetical protein SAMN02745121_04997 [Nannocystis exedens]|uniref:Uncharacterized protein n=1 Tax=Nannocystis exedens TaxID=54 RepID=A0A1I2CAD9_9BACT|nr:hypothetical protein [Nannocystis exedens]PCC68433.1 hypothetical protein NAEX_01447 [Nannocystis exedens]SFE65135.1 hypothetical protein SAMN02745121_04997 [Nannocystis exedens]
MIRSAAGTRRSRCAATTSCSARSIHWLTPPQSRVGRHFAYTPLGEGETDVNLDEGLTIRVDGFGRSFLRGPGEVVLRADYP